MNVRFELDTPVYCFMYFSIVTMLSSSSFLSASPLPMPCLSAPSIALRPAVSFDIVRPLSTPSAGIMLTRRMAMKSRV
jgi:hypothetical protein